MVRNKLGKTNIEVSILGLGTVKIGRNQNVKYPQPFNLPSDDDVKNLLHTAAQAGINLIDTAPAYGSSEKRLGQLLFQNHNYQRSDWVIITKAGEEFHPNPNPQITNNPNNTTTTTTTPVSTYNFTPEAITHSVHQSLQKLQTDYIDILLIHSDGISESQIFNQLGTITALCELKQKGLIKAFGLSSKTIAGGLATIQNCDLAMITYNPHDTTQLDVIKAAHKQSKGVLIKKALDSGHHITTNIPASSTSTQTTNDPVYNAYKFIYQQPAINSIITGTINPNHLKQNINAAIKAYNDANEKENENKK